MRKWHPYERHLCANVPLNFSVVRKKIHTSDSLLEKKDDEKGVTLAEGMTREKESLL